ncbi:hypothetical protein GCM10010977_04510 [Citricoccus zhacaiensis]|uniref:O-antigen ligase-related domain-containing protein n=1 Tax=Citricoccus zhacaiensis TaxID=489142 RepID=A0ABQ2LNV9_9MICC|nr:O-antigen ligase family protein [Citricoccus zhacaiensis]GGO41104.1 hypothetical protein GCM10010977_04510 [Citricoccus zhacaiensis]
MTALSTAPAKTVQRPGRPVGGPLVLRWTMFLAVGFPAYLVWEPAGASGGVAQLLALALLGLWLASAVFGRFSVWEFRHPARVGMMVWLLVSLLSYAALMAGMSGTSTVAERAAADRWLLLLMAGIGLTLSITQCLLTREDVRRAVGWMLAGASVSGLVAALQFTTLTNPVDWLATLLPGFQDNGSGTPFQPRGSFTRVAGMTMHPIELGVVSSMLLPLSIWWGLFSTWSKAWRRWVPAVMLAICCVATVSRSAMLGLFVSAAVMIPYLPRTARRWALVAGPAFLIVLFVAIPGMVSTLFGTATAGSSDPSITARTDDYPLAWTLLVQLPVFGHGPGTWMPVNAMDIFDNEYLFTAVTMGVVGLAGLVIYLLVPALSSMLAARHAPDPELRLLAGSVAAAMFVALASSAAFDSMSFKSFALLVPIFVGLAGTVWLLVLQQLNQTPGIERSTGNHATRKKYGGRPWIR